MNDDPRYSVVVPVFRNESSVPALVAALVWLSSELDDRLEVVFVVDGSPDGSRAALISELSNARLPAQVLELSRNFGSFPAIRTGLGRARGEFVAVMTADLQEPVEAVLAFLRRLEVGDADIVIGTRTVRDDPGTSAAASALYWRLYRRLVNREIPPGGVDVFACTREVSQLLAAFPETHTSLVGLLYWIGYRRVEVPYERQARHSGTSAWSTRKKLRYLADSVYAFTDLPVLMLQFLGIVGVLSSLAVAAAVFIAWVAGWVSEPGYTPLMLAVSFSTSLILIGLGVVGSYVWRSYENGKARPVTIVMRSDVFGAEGGSQA